MTTTTNLLITHIESSQAQKEVTANDAFNNLDAAIAGRLALSTTGGTTTLTDAQARNAIMDVSGALTSNAVIDVPARSKLYAVRNATTGAFTLTVKTASGTGVIVAQGYSAVLFCDGVNVSAATDAQMADHLAASDPHPQYATDADLSAHTGAATGAHAASAISYTPAGNLAATDVAAALNELDAEKSGLGLANTFTQTQTAPQYNIGDANALLRRAGTHLSSEARGANAINWITGQGGVRRLVNARYDGSNYYRLDDSQPAAMEYVTNSGSLYRNTAPAGTGAITWGGGVEFWHSGNLDPDPAATANTIAQRDSSGRLAVANATATGQAAALGQLAAQRHAAKVWLSYDGVANTIKGSYGVSSVTDDGVGIYTVNFSTPFANDKYSHHVQAGRVADTGTASATWTRNKLAASARLVITNGSGTAADYEDISYAAYGDQ